VYEFRCDLCDADYVGYTRRRHVLKPRIQRLGFSTCPRRHLSQCIEEHKHSAIGKHFRDAHNQMTKDLQKQFTILKKCCGKLECLIYEMLFIKDKKPKLKTQSDSMKAKLFT